MQFPILFSNLCRCHRGLRIKSFLSSALPPNRIEMHFLFIDNFYAPLSLSLSLPLLFLWFDDTQNTGIRVFRATRYLDIELYFAAADWKTRVCVPHTFAGIELTASDWISDELPLCGPFFSIRGNSDRGTYRGLIAATDQVISNIARNNVI